MLLFGHVNALVFPSVVIAIEFLEIIVFGPGIGIDQARIHVDDGPQRPSFTILQGNDPRIRCARYAAGYGRLYIFTGF